jgi:polysaccharide export outer membrane protein
MGGWGMKQRGKILCWFLVLCCCLVPGLAHASGGHPKPVGEGTPPLPDAQQKVAKDASYVIGAGDVLLLTVWKDAALSRQMVVLPDGTVSLPLGGNIVAAGKTVAQLESEIAGKLEEYMTDPVLDISIVQANSMIVFVIGKVLNPGRFPVSTDINVLQAIAMAGGPNRFADTDSIQVHRKEKGRTLLLDFNYDEVLRGVRLEQNIQLQRGDVVVVP